MNNLSFFNSVVRNLYFNLLLRMFVGWTFIVSGVSKLPHHTEFEAVVKDYDLLPDGLAGAYANILPWLELLVGVYLVIGILVRPALLVVIFMALSFLVANISSLAGDDHYCGSCFGDLWSLPAWQALIFDIAVLLTASHLVFHKSENKFLTLDAFLKDS